MRHHLREAIEARLTIVFAALAVASSLEDATGVTGEVVLRIAAAGQL